MKTKLLTLATLAFIGLSTANAQVGIGTTTPNASAALDVDVTSLTDKKGFLPPRMTQTERNAITDPAEGLMIYNTTQNCMNVFVKYWRNLCAFDNTASIGTITFDGLDYETVFNPVTGLTWLDRNLGASQVATGPTDTDAYGDLYQWGRGTDGHQLRSLDCNNPADCYDANDDNNNLPLNAADVTNATWAGKFIFNMASPNDWHQANPDDTLWQGVNGTNNPCPSGYRIPTEAELNAERLSWSSNDSAGAFDSPLKLPVAGYRFFSTGGINLVGSDGRYWSSTVSNNFTRRLNFNSSNASMISSFRAIGLSVRCLKD